MSIKADDRADKDRLGYEICPREQGRNAAFSFKVAPPESGALHTITLCSSRRRFCWPVLSRDEDLLVPAVVSNVLLEQSR